MNVFLMFLGKIKAFIEVNECFPDIVCERLKYL